MQTLDAEIEALRSLQREQDAFTKEDGISHELRRLEASLAATETENMEIADMEASVFRRELRGEATPGWISFRASIEGKAMEAEDALSRQLEDNGWDGTDENWETNPDYLYLKGSDVGSDDKSSHVSEEEKLASRSSESSHDSDSEPGSAADLLEPPTQRASDEEGHGSECHDKEHAETGDQDTANLDIDELSDVSDCSDLFKVDVEQDLGYVTSEDKDLEIISRIKDYL